MPNYKFPEAKEDIRELYVRKNEYLSNRYDTLDPHAFYRKLFPEGTIGKRGDYESDLGHPMMQIWFDKCTKDGTLLQDEKGFRQFKLIFDDLKKIDYELPTSQNYEAPRAGEVRRNGIIYISPFSYFGKSARENLSRRMFAFVIDLDEVIIEQIKAIEYYISRDAQMPEPSLIVNSGTGLHLYYLLKEPEPMIPKNRKYFKQIKNCLITACCNDGTTCKVKGDNGAKGGDRLSLTQGHRAPGSRTKLGRDCPAIAYQFSDRVYELADFWKYFLQPMPEHPSVFFSKHEYDTVPLVQAKVRWPEWYERRIVRGEPRKTWVSYRGVYDWWLNQCRTSEQVRQGIRYYCIFTLAVFAAKNNVPFEELKADANSLLEYFNSKTEEETNPFLQSDIDSAIKIYFKTDAKTYTRTFLEEKTWKFGTHNRHNGRTQEEHMKIARAICDTLHPDGSWREGNGRPIGSGTAQNDVLAWRAKHPDGTKSQCKAETGLSYPTIRKWWDTKINEGDDENAVS